VARSRQGHQDDKEACALAGRRSLGFTAAPRFYVGNLKALDASISRIFIDTYFCQALRPQDAYGLRPRNHGGASAIGLSATDA
jgi:hypothetical protein